MNVALDAHSTGKKYKYMLLKSLVVLTILPNTGLSATATAAPSHLAAAATPTETLRREPGMDDAESKVYAETSKMMPHMQRSGTARKMLNMLLPVVGDSRHPLLVGRLVVAAAALASSANGRQAVDKLLAAAKARPDDQMAAFVAGVAVHYRGHVRGTSRDSKSADYRRAIELLEPLRETLAKSPRLWIYLAVSYLRTGRQKDAEFAIERAVATDDGGDADVYYCRAEVHHRIRPKRALADIERYIAIMARNKKHGAWSATGKEQRVAEMRAHMQAVVAGDKPPSGIELFDPIRDPLKQQDSGNPYLIWWLLVAAAALVVGGLWWRRLSRSRRRSRH